MTIDIHKETMDSLKDAITKGNFSGASTIIENNIKDLNSKIDDNDNILSFTVKNLSKENSEEVSNFLLELHNKGMDFDDKYYQDAPLLMNAIYNDNAFLTKAFLSTNNYNDFEKTIALDIACEENISLKTFLHVFSKASEFVDVKNEKGNSAIAKLAASNYDGVENKLFSMLRASEDKEAINNQDQNSLFQAVETGTAKTAKLLLSININVNHTDKYQRNALFRVDGPNEDEIKKKLQYLVEAGIDTEQLNKSNKSAFEVNTAIAPYRDFVNEIKEAMNKPKDAFDSIMYDSAQRKRASLR